MHPITPFNALDKVFEALKKIKKLYEGLLESEREKVKLFKNMIEK